MKYNRWKEEYALNKADEPHQQNWHTTTLLIGCTQSIVQQYILTYYIHTIYIYFTNITYNTYIQNIDHISDIATSTRRRQDW